MESILGFSKSMLLDSGVPGRQLSWDEILIAKTLNEDFKRHVRDIAL